MTSTYPSSRNLSPIEYENLTDLKGLPVLIEAETAQKVFRFKDSSSYCSFLKAHAEIKTIGENCGFVVRNSLEIYLDLRDCAKERMSP